MNTESIGVLGTEDLKVQRDEMSEKIQTLFALLRQALSQREIDQAERLFGELLQWTRLSQTIEEIAGKLAVVANEVPSYLIGASFLSRAYTKLGSIPTESILYLAGYKFGNSFVAAELVPFELEISNYGYASGEVKSVATSLIHMEEEGSLLCAHFHMHPGKGPTSNYPSSIDIATQRRFETGGLPAVGGIFSRDGYLRFFGDKIQFTIFIAGKGVTKVGTNLYKLNQIR